MILIPLASPTGVMDKLQGLIYLERLLESSQWERAFSEARRQMEDSPESVYLHRCAGQAAMGLESYDAAGLHLHQALKLDPACIDTKALLSGWALEKGRFKEARRWIDEAIMGRPDEAAFRVLSAELRYRRGDILRAIQETEEALELAPENMDALNLLAIINQNRGQCPRTAGRQALEDLHRALSIDPENPIILYNIGSIFLDDFDRPKEAVAYFRKALAADPQMRMAKRGLILALRRFDPLVWLLYSPMRFAVLPVGRLYAWGARRIWPMLFLVPTVYIFLTTLSVTYGFWVLFCFPAMKLYEWVTFRECLRIAGIVTSRDFGGATLPHRWPLAVRQGIFLAGVSAWWGGLWYGLSRFAGTEAILWIGYAGLALLLGNMVFQIAKRRHIWQK